MKAVVLENTRNIVVREVRDAHMREATDVLLRLTSTAICGTDLHFYEGRMPGLESQVIGLEPLGFVEEVGSAVKNYQDCLEARIEDRRRTPIPAKSAHDRQRTDNTPREA